MISSLRGTVIAVGVSSAVLEVGGVGYAIGVTPAHAATLRTGSEALVHTALIVREDDLSLFGFATRGELELFDLLRGVSGVGPKSALGVLATLTPDEIARAVSAEDDAPFRRVSGIGPKTAKLIAVSLQGKVAVPRATAAAIAPRGIETAVIDALTGLGWPERVAAQTVSDLAGEAGDVQGLLRLALAQLGPAVRA